MNTTAQLKHLLVFELLFFFRKFWIYLILLGFLGMGFVGGSVLSAFSTENIYRNSPFAITYIVGYLSLICVFLTSILAAQVLFREQEHHFSMVLYATPLKKINFFLSRFMVIFGITVLAMFLLIMGFMIGQKMSRFDASEFEPFHISYYLQPFVLLIIPNIFFCSAVVCSVGLLSKHKLLVYVSALFIFIGYQVTLIFSGSPLIAGAMPPTEESMRLAAYLDPFGLSAFLHQTLQWSAIQRNIQLTALTGSMLVNRVIYMAFSVIGLLVSYCFFRFSVDEKSKKVKEKPLAKTNSGIYRAIIPKPFSLLHNWQSMCSIIKIDLTFVVRSISFLLILIGIIFFVSMEMYGEVEQGIRIPELYVSTSLMVNTILETFPVLCSLVVLFYSNELLWRSRISNFHLIENTTPHRLPVRLFAHWLSMGFIVLLLLAGVIMTGIVFQLVYEYRHIEWTTYLYLSYLVGLPLLLTSGVIIIIQSIIKNRYAGLIVANVFVLLTTTRLGIPLHIKHPLLRIGAAFSGEHSAMNGFGAYTYSFNWRMLFGSCTVLLLMIMAIQVQKHSKKVFNSPTIVGLVVLLTGAGASGYYISNRIELSDTEATLQWQENYEKKYRLFENLPQPTIKAIQTSIDLFPEINAYSVKATYTLKNQTKQPIEKLLFYIKPEITLKSLQVDRKQAVITDKESGHYWVNLEQPLQPDDSLIANFEFGYVWNNFNRLASFNAIVENGAFMRISNYFPQLGYQPNNEINDAAERKKRKLGAATSLKLLEAPRETNAQRINLDMLVSTTASQSAIGVGELVKQWTHNNRNYFHYKTNTPIRFRFGVSSARYAIQKTTHRGIEIEVYYHPAHPENVDGLILNAKNTLDYCEANFGTYPFKTIRFAEISSFTKGFAATAYPATIFMPENMIFHANIRADNQQDVINELAAHELSHEWWGTNQFITDRREGSDMLSETFAMYTELMLTKKMYGPKRVLENVKMHRNIYLNDRGFSSEQALYKSDEANVYLFYSKGLVVMYQLSELIGEEKVNTALRNLYHRYANSNVLPVSTDFLEELYSLTDASVHTVIDELFKKIIIYQPAAQRIRTQRMGNKYKTSFDITVQKLEEDGNGKQTPQVYNGTIEIGFYGKDNKEQIKVFSVSHNKASVSVSHTERPLKMVLDPHEKLIKSDDGTSYSLK
ncbi:ABC transporter permease/M1 family aminopeptidase [Emticicia sp. 17c]|uniref:ABC transporter permease/M1 family aminopeptidase n=1 Tax=Emticicia sp. 17c TaxID=3127704 RepID=UPI00301CA841